LETKFFIAFIASLRFHVPVGFLWYAKLMNGAHQEVPILWRTPADFGNHFSSLVFGHIVMALFSRCFARVLSRQAAQARVRRWDFW